MSTISTQVNHAIVLGSAGYTSPLTITSSGGVDNSTAGNAIFGSTGTIVNDGKITSREVTNRPLPVMSRETNRCAESCSP